MAEHGEIPATWTGLAAAATFFGGVLAAIFGRKTPEPNGPEKGGDMADALQRIASLEARATEAERRDADAAKRDEAIFSRLNSLDKKASATLAILDERRQQR